jgi:hypothetical protein
MKHRTASGSLERIDEVFGGTAFLFRVFDLLGAPLQMVDEGVW